MTVALDLVMDAWLLIPLGDSFNNLLGYLKWRTCVKNKGVLIRIGAIKKTTFANNEVTTTKVMCEVISLFRFPS